MDQASPLRKRTLDDAPNDVLAWLAVEVRTFGNLEEISFPESMTAAMFASSH